MAGVFPWGWGCPVFPRPCGAGSVLADLIFIWPVAVCAGGPLRAGGVGLVSGFSGPVTGAHTGGGGGCSVGCVVVAVFWPVRFRRLGCYSVCGGLLSRGGPCHWACFVPFWGETWLDEVGLTVSFPCLAALWCASPCCAVLCCALRCYAALCRVMLCCAVVWCGVLCPALPCRAVPYGAVL